MFFRNGRKSRATRRDADPTAPDGMFPHLPRHRADFLRQQTLRLLDDEGYDTTLRPDAVVEARYVAPPAHPSASPDPATLFIALEPLSLQLADAGAHASGSELLELIRRHLRRHTTTAPASSSRPGPAELSDADFLRHLRIRLTTDATLAAMSGSFDDASRALAGDLHVSLVLDTPDSVVVLDDSALAAHGTATAGELADLYRVGYRNTWQELSESDVRSTPVREFDPGTGQGHGMGSGRGTGRGAVHAADPAARYWTMESDSFFHTSALEFLDELLPYWVPGLDTGDGVIVAVPHRHLMLVREVSTGQDLLEGVKAMSAAALDRHGSRPGPLSPRLFLRHDGATTAFTEVTTNAEGRQVVTIRPDAYLASRLES
ncbi:hypothetical protein [Corynebacterium sp.]|uniref:hypothetical protein n=1 Tax=Corynebacterium sp. TaxID=1720 RepID=UPI0025C55ED3|nr:hypothetical protein [Corynebacterium sp.]